jgi:aminoglycoside 3-N-acetyltransferase
MHKTALTDLEGCLVKMNFPKEAVVMIHSSLLKFGIIEKGVKGFYECIEEVLGPEATIIMPAFSFGFTENKQWFAKDSKSHMGALTEYFRKKVATGRTIHPFHSVSFKGKYSSKFLSCNSSSSFGSNSPFNLFCEMDAFNLSLGADYIGGTTYMHYTEEVAQVPYRCYKTFPGEVFDHQDKLVEQSFKMFVRIITTDYEYDNDWTKVFSELVQEGYFNYQKLGLAKIIKSDIKKTHQAFYKKILANPYYAARVIHKNVTEREI